MPPPGRTSLMPYQRFATKPKLMADGFNEARALRITEIMTDFQILQRRIAEYAPNPPPEDYYEEGYEVLRQCRAEAQAVLVVPYPIDLSQASSGSDEQEKHQLQRVILDASARRFQSKKIYLRAVAAVRWSNARNVILNNGKSPQSQNVLLQQANNSLRAVCSSIPDAIVVANALKKELAATTDVRIANELRQADAQAGYWLQDDPSLATILNWIRSQHA
ncbi:MAG: hypothetical protein Q9220_002150 [cf. Caloplaca sp. 1 TL-2023]